MEKVIKIKVPAVPSFLLDEKGNSHSIADFTEKELTQLGEEFTSDLLKHARKIRKAGEDKKNEGV